MYRWFVFLLILLPSAIFAQPEYVDHPPSAKKNRAQWRGDRILLGDTLTLWLDWPEKAVLEKGKKGETRNVVMRLVLKTKAGEPVGEWEQSFQAYSSGTLARRPSFTLSLPGTCPQGELVLTLHGGEGVHAEMLPEPLRLRKVDDALARVVPEHREEMESWIREANHERMIWGKQPLWPNLERALDQPQAPYRDLKGFLIRSYENRHLRRRQPYTVYVPETLDLSEPAPLMILLHGSGGDYRNLVADYAAGQRFEEHPMLIANAGAFRNTEFRHMVLEDVREIVEDMQRKYNVDPKRIYAQGISLGGRGVLELAALMPDTFAAVSSQGSYGVYHDWMDPLFPLQEDRVALQLSARSDIRTWLPNLATTPVEMAFGWQDESTRPVGALAIAIRLQRLRYSVVERGFDSGHNITLPEYDWASTRAWFLKQEKNLWPRFLRFRVSNLRHNRFSWLRVDALHDPAGVGQVEARMTPQGPQVKVWNVARLTLLSPPEEEAGFTFAEQTLYFDAEGHPVEDPEKPLAVGSIGPLWDIFSEPVILVVDGEVEADLVKRFEAVARMQSRTDATPEFQFPVRRARDLTPEERASHNLIIYTTADSPSQLRTALSIPLPPDAEALREETDALTAIRPSPWSDQHKVVVIDAGGPSVPSLYHAGLFQEPLQADWILWDRSRRIKAAGSFHADGRPGPWTATDFTTRVITR